MLISDFARATGLTPDAIRFYVRRGLLDPQLGAKGGRNPYQVFSEEHVQVAQVIRLGQALGLSLREIGTLLADGRAGRLGPERTIAIMLNQRDRLRRKAAELTTMADYLDAKVAWTRAGSSGLPPAFPRLTATRNESIFARVESPDRKQ